MRRPSAHSRLEAVALAAVLASPLPMLALAPDGGEALVMVLLASVPVAIGWGIYRLALRGRPRRIPRPALVAPPLGPVPAEIRSSPFRVRRGRRVVAQGTFEDVLAAARAGRLGAFDAVEGGGVVAAPSDFADLVAHVPSRVEAHARRLYLSYLAVAAVAGSAGIAVLAAARLSLVAADERSALLVLLFAAALVPLPFLRREWRRIAAGRPQGLVPEPPPRRTFGSAALDAALAGPTRATRGVLLVVVAVSVAAMLLPPEALLERLAKDNDAIRAGEIWRLLTVGLVHGGALHLFMNGFVLSNVGGFVERLLGARRMLAVLWGGVLAGSLASFATNPHPSVGISGGLFALVGALLVAGLRHRRALPPPARRVLVRAPLEIIVLNVALGLALPMIDNAAHLGGLAGGILLGLLLDVRIEVRATLRSSGRATVASGPSRGG
jgi:membrane associated rhomboid family serine protease